MAIFLAFAWRNAHTIIIYSFFDPTSKHSNIGHDKNK